MAADYELGGPGSCADWPSIEEWEQIQDAMNNAGGSALERARRPNRPHYKVGGIESIDVIRAKLPPEAYYGFCMGNVMKYTQRAGHKGERLDDLKKALDYLRWAIECEEQKE